MMAAIARIPARINRDKIQPRSVFSVAISMVLIN